MTNFNSVLMVSSVALGAVAVWQAGAYCAKLLQEWEHTQEKLHELSSREVVEVVDPVLQILNTLLSTTTDPYIVRDYSLALNSTLRDNLKIHYTIHTKTNMMLLFKVRRAKKSAAQAATLTAPRS